MPMQQHRASGGGQNIIHMGDSGNGGKIPQVIDQMLH